MPENSLSFGDGRLLKVNSSDDSSGSPPGGFHSRARADKWRAVYDTPKVALEKFVFMDVILSWLVARRKDVTRNGFALLSLADAPAACLTEARLDAAGDRTEDGEGKWLPWL